MARTIRPDKSWHARCSAGSDAVCTVGHVHDRTSLGALADLSDAVCTVHGRQNWSRQVLVRSDAVCTLHGMYGPYARSITCTTGADKSWHGRCAAQRMQWYGGHARPVTCTTRQVLARSHACRMQCLHGEVTDRTLGQVTDRTLVRTDHLYSVHQFSGWSFSRTRGLLKHRSILPCLAPNWHGHGKHDLVPIAPGTPNAAVLAVRAHKSFERSDAVCTVGHVYDRTSLGALAHLSEAVVCTVR